ncbi:hypothetical protein LISE100100_00390 [Listeria seeligeri]|uniref:hypothetical protein n=1 Tax=Listeria seeligeri TaxID=1640 RepID=UPI0001C4EC46|nr:hypothetical protein [Listeria seeligeri]CBH27746.1 hypothetical protein lse_1595 [Listeria seeligeri serovar 1/2b str. SLCC3954]
MTKLVTMSEKNESGELEVFFPQTHVEAILGLDDVIKKAVDELKPVTLFEGAANGVSATRYTLAKSIDEFSKIRVIYSGAGGTYKCETFKRTTSIVLDRSNQSDSGTSTTFWEYECGLDFAGKTYFTIIRDVSVRQSNGTTTPTANANEFTILAIEGLNY